MNDSRKTGSIFESINLSSTINDGPQYPTYQPILESAAGMSEEEDLDPTDFLSGSPELLKDIKPTAQVHKSGSISRQVSPQVVDPHHSIYDSDINDSILENLNVLIPEYKGSSHSVASDFVPSGNADSPLQYLQNEHQRLWSELNHHVHVHQQALENGSDSLHRIRDAIGVYFHKLSENQYSLNELYHREGAYNQQVHKRLLKWDSKRTAILERIKAIKSETTSYGSKLSGLLNESSSLDSEIASLEAKLLTLKSKKQLLQNEIDVTSSVLESRTSRFVNAFKELDKNGELAIRETLRQNGLSDKQSQVLVKKVDVDVTFGKGYKNLAESRIASPIETAANTPQSALNSTPDTTAANAAESSKDMGMQAYEPDLAAFTNTVEEEDPYKKGFSKGQQSSERIKTQLQQIYETYIKPFLEQQKQLQSQTLKVDDTENTISSKIDMNPIISFLEHKVAAYEELAKNAGAMSARYHHYNELWKDVCSSLSHREAELENSIVAHDVTVDTSIASILCSTLDDLLLFVTKATKSALPLLEPASPLSKLLESEVGALLKALEMVPSVTKSSAEYKTEFRNNGLFKDISVVAKNHHKSPSPPRLDYTQTKNANVIEHRVVKDPPITVKKQPSGTLNGKSLKGE